MNHSNVNRRTPQTHASANKRLLCLLLALCLSILLLPVTVSAESNTFTVNGLQYTLNSDGTTVGVAGASNLSTLITLNIPASVIYNGKSYPVTKTLPNSFANAPSLQSAHIPQGITELGTRTFSQCSVLGTVTFETGMDSLKTLGNYVFYNCVKLSSIRLPDSLQELGEGAFSLCKGLLSLYLPPNVTSIGTLLLSGCTELKAVTLPSSAAFTSIPGWTFEGCKNLASITIPNNISSITATAFSGCTALNSINISPVHPYFSTSSGAIFNKDKTELIVYLESNTRDTYEIPGSVTSIGSHAFFGCMRLVKIIIPNSVTAIGERAFSYCTSLKTVVLSPDSGLLSMGDYVFYGDSALAEITIPDSVISVGTTPFASTPLPPLLPAPTGAAWDKNTVGKAVWNAVDGASGYSLRLYQDGAVIGEAASASGTSHNFSDAIAAAGDGTFTFSVRAITASASYQNSISAMSATPLYLSASRASVKMRYAAGVNGGTLYNINFSWGAMEFIYKEAGPGIWNPASHRYDQASEAGWYIEREGGDLIKVENHSNAAVTVSFAYQSDTEYLTVRGTLTGDNISDGKATLASAENSDPENPPAVTAQLSLSGTPPASTEQIVIGTVTVTVASAL